MVHRRYTVLFFCILIPCIQNVLCTFSFTEDDISIRVNQAKVTALLITNPLDLINYVNVTVDFDVEHENIISVKPKSLKITDEIFAENYFPVIIRGIAPGKSDISAKISPDQLNKKGDGFTIVSVHKSDVIVAISNIIGWIYFLAWSFSFYPQVWTNFFRKSVVGLSFDFVSLNIVGYACYSAFNVGLYAIPIIREQYAERFPRSVIPVLTNDIIFALHGATITIITGIQCLIYESNKQKVSNIVKIQHFCIGCLLVLSVSLVIFKCILWLDFMYVCSYVKLFLTLTKYIPQAYMNYERKSTVGWNIYTVIADIIGGLFSISQMFLNAYNYDEWESLIENPTKFWLGVVSILFDVVFMVQHYILYKDDTHSDTESILEEEKSNFLKA